jgi:hypothetical protein
MKKLKTKWAYSAAVAFGILLPLQAEDTTSHGKMSREDDVLVTATAKVEAVDLEKRELTLKGPLGDVETVTVDKAVKRLDEIKPGDEVTAKYYVSIAAELRDPTPEEKENPIMVVSGAERAPKSSAPAAGGLRMIRVVATVEGLQRPTRLVTLKGPRGNYMSVRAKDPKRLEKLHLGDTIVVTFTEALAIAVEKTK